MNPIAWDKVYFEPAGTFEQQANGFKIKLILRTVVVSADNKV